MFCKDCEYHEYERVPTVGNMDMWNALFCKRGDEHSEIDQVYGVARESLYRKRCEDVRGTELCQPILDKRSWFRKKIEAIL